MDERFEQPEREPHGASGQPDTTSQSESGRDPERERLLRETQIEIDRMKAAAMEEIQSSTAAYVQMQVQLLCDGLKVLFLGNIICLLYTSLTRSVLW